MTLATHARATRMLADAFATESGVTRDKGVGAVLAAMSLAYNGAAAAMEEASRTEAATLQHGCSIDHRALPLGKTCPLCKAPRG